MLRTTFRVRVEGRVRVRDRDKDRVRDRVRDRDRASTAVSEDNYVAIDVWVFQSLGLGLLP